MENQIFVVTTQGLENYGAHCESGRFADGQAYWKFKSGTDYLVSGLTRPQDAMAFVAAIGIENGIGWKEFPSEVVTLEEYRDQFDLSDEYDREHYEFKMSIMRKVDPRETFGKKEVDS
jgi:hypothetical protein